VNQLARLCLENNDPIGKRIVVDRVLPSFIVGVAGNPEPATAKTLFYFPQSQDSDHTGGCEVDLVVRTFANPLTLEQPVRTVLAGINANTKYPTIWNIDGRSHD
jgi:hypothetical protein